MLIEGTHPTRVAVLSEDLITKVVTAFAYTSVAPTRFFTDKTEATAWLLDPHTNTTANTGTGTGTDTDTDTDT